MFMNDMGRGERERRRGYVTIHIKLYVKEGGENPPYQALVLARSV